MNQITLKNLKVGRAKVSPRFPAREYKLAPPGQFYLPLRDCHGWCIVSAVHGTCDGPYASESLVEALCAAMNTQRNLAVELDRAQRDAQRSYVTSVQRSLLPQA